MAIDLLAVAQGMGAVVNTKQVTELVFPQGRKLILENLLEVDERQALKLLTEAALPGPFTR